MGGVPQPTQIEAQKFSEEPDAPKGFALGDEGLAFQFMQALGECEPTDHPEGNLLQPHWIFTFYADTRILIRGMVWQTFGFDGKDWFKDPQQTCWKFLEQLPAHVSERL